MTLEYSGEKLANSVAIFLKCGQPLTSSAKPHQAQVGPILLKIYLRLSFLLSALGRVVMGVEGSSHSGNLCWVFLYSNEMFTGIYRSPST